MLIIFSLHRPLLILCWTAPQKLVFFFILLFCLKSPSSYHHLYLLYPLPFEWLLSKDGQRALAAIVFSLKSTSSMACQPLQWSTHTEYADHLINWTKFINYCTFVWSIKLCSFSIIYCRVWLVIKLFSSPKDGVQYMYIVHCTRWTI